MKQHPIPQNILDVEFKLFTRFTVREFAYMAIGIGFGGIFLYFFSRGEVPGFVAIPIFIVSTGAGLILGLTKINDQNADVFVRNYIAAITRPTLRVWRSENFDEKVEWIAKQRGLTLTKGTLDREVNLEQKSNTRVVGGTAKLRPGGQYVDDETLNALDQEEEEALKNIDAIAVEETGVSLPGSDAEAGRKSTTFVQQSPEQTAQVRPMTPPIQPTQDPKTAPTPPPAPPQQSTPPSQPELSPGATGTTPSVSTDQPIQKPPEQRPAPPPQPEASKPNVEPMKSDVISPPSPSSVSAQNQVVISKETVNSYRTEVEDYTPGPGSIAMYLTNKNGEGVPQAMALVKDRGGSVVQALQSDPQGLVLPTKEFSKGEYIVNIQHDKYNFPRVNFILEGMDMPVVNIKSL